MLQRSKGKQIKKYIPPIIYFRIIEFDARNSGGIASVEIATLNKGNEKRAAAGQPVITPSSDFMISIMVGIQKLDRDKIAATANAAE